MNYEEYYENEIKEAAELNSNEYSGDCDPFSISAQAFEDGAKWMVRKLEDERDIEF